ncbi:hypothetical protein LguiB_019984 [Lonicera macranthoides]
MNKDGLLDREKLEEVFKHLEIGARLPVGSAGENSPLILSSRITEAYKLHGLYPEPL